MNKDNFFRAKKIDVGLISFTIYGKSTTKRYKIHEVEIILDEDDLDKLIGDLQNAMRTKVTIR